MRWLIWLHRYVGIAIGWLIVAWCLSGVVMMYVAYPEVTREEELQALPALDVSECCNLAAAATELGDARIADFSIEMLAGHPVLRSVDDFGRAATLDLVTGERIISVSAALARAQAASMIRDAGSRGRLEYLGAIDRDQWTVAGDFDAHRPLHHFALHDAQGSEWYISSRTGQLVQETQRLERGWNWVGAVVHWIYPTRIRENPVAWIQVIIWTTLIGLFLTLAGLYIGVGRLRRRPGGRWSPYRGIAWWHHCAGLAFGLLALTWLASGLLSINPWGWLQGASGLPEWSAVRGTTSSWPDVERAAAMLGLSAASEPIVKLESAPLGGRSFVVVYDERGTAIRWRLASNEPEPVTEAELLALVPQLLDGRRTLSAELINEPDNFYFSHHNERELPVFRVVADDPERTRYYLSATTGQLVQKADAAQRWYRWLFAGLHRFDLTATMRARPLWDLFMLVLLTGVTILSATGTYMGARFLARKARATGRTS